MDGPSRTRNESSPYTTSCFVKSTQKLSLWCVSEEQTFQKEFVEESAKVLQFHKNYSPQPWSIFFGNPLGNGYGISVNGTWSTNLRFAGDVILIAKPEEELLTITNDPDQHWVCCGWKISASKTKVMAISDTSITLRGKDVSTVKSIIYLGQDSSLYRDTTKEVTRRIRAAWNQFLPLRKFLTSRAVETK